MDSFFVPPLAQKYSSLAAASSRRGAATSTIRDNALGSPVNLYSLHAADRRPRRGRAPQWLIASAAKGVKPMAPSVFPVIAVLIICRVESVQFRTDAPYFPAISLSHSMFERPAKFLLEFFVDRLVASGVVCTKLALIDEDISQIIGTGRETITRTLLGD